MIFSFFFRCNYTFSRRNFVERFNTLRNNSHFDLEAEAKLFQVVALAFCTEGH